MTDCALIGIRQKEDSFNQIAAGAITGGLLAFRAGARVAFKNAIFGGMILGSITIVEKLMMKFQKKQELDMQK
jgi:import inner membrane translocase subunit TIM17